MIVKKYAHAILVGLRNNHTNAIFMKKLLLLPTLLISTASYGSHFSPLLKQYPVIPASGIVGLAIAIEACAPKLVNNRVTAEIGNMVQHHPISTGACLALGALLLKQGSTFAPHAVKSMVSSVFDIFGDSVKKNPWFTTALVLGVLGGPALIRSIKKLNSSTT